MTSTPGDGADRIQELADGHRIPMLGLGVWQVRDGPQCIDAVRWALELGYRHIDTAQAYGNEESVGVGVRQSGIPRDQVFITTKFYPASRDPVKEVERSLERLEMEYVDLYWSIGPGAAPCEPGRGWSRRANSAWLAQSASRTSASPSWIRS